MGKAFYKKGLYKREWFESTKYIDFEKIRLKVPFGLEAFLTERFGDYMKPPSEDRIKWEQHAESWNVDTDFRKISDKEYSFKDEMRLI